MKKLLIVVVILFFVAHLIDESIMGEEEKIVKTNFTNCKELYNYVKDENYNSLEKLWGTATLGEPWDASAVGELRMRIYATWYNVKINGQAVSLKFENRYYDLTDVMDKNPTKFIATECN